MAWARYDDELSMNRKVGWLVAQGPTGVAALGLQLLANTWSRHEGLGGFVPEHQPGLLVGDVKLGRKLADLLERAEMFDITDGGWMLHDFDEYSDPNDDGKPAADRKREISAARAANGRLGGLAKAKQTASKPPSKPLAKAKQSSAPGPDPVPVPVPSADISDDDDSENTPDGLSSSDLATALATYLERSARHNTTPARWIQGTARNILAERRPELDQCIADGLTQRQAVMRLTGRAEPASQPDGRWHAHPHCPDCDGSGWASVGGNTFDACKCRQDRPHELPLATVHTLREAHG